MMEKSPGQSRMEGLFQFILEKEYNNEHWFMFGFLSFYHKHQLVLNSYTILFCRKHTL